MSNTRKSKEMINFDELRAEDESDDEEEEEDNSSRFPYPLNRETINKTPSLDIPGGK